MHQGKTQVLRKFSSKLCLRFQFFRRVFLLVGRHTCVSSASGHRSTFPSRRLAHPNPKRLISLSGKFWRVVSLTRSSSTAGLCRLSSIFCGDWAPLYFTMTWSRLFLLKLAVITMVFERLQVSGANGGRYRTAHLAVRL